MIYKKENKVEYLKNMSHLNEVLIDDANINCNKDGTKLGKDIKDKKSNNYKYRDKIGVSKMSKLYKNAPDYTANCLLGLKILESKESERKRIAGDLHDSTIQNLTSIMHKAELCSHLIDTDPISAKLELQIMKNAIKSTINEMRKVIFDLRPMILDDLGFIPAVERYINNLSREYEILIKLHVSNEIDYNNLQIINLTLFRIIQEATNNAIKHGKATNIDITIHYNNNNIILEIQDDGTGFDNNTNDKNKLYSGYGLSTMKERVLCLSGEIEIQSVISKGTKVSIKVPLMTCEEDYNETN